MKIVIDYPDIDEKSTTAVILVEWLQKIMMDKQEYPNTPLRYAKTITIEEVTG